MRMTAMLLLAALAGLPGLAQAKEGVEYDLVAVRFPVSDFERSIDFYTKLGMKRGMRYTPKEQQVTWEDPGKGPNIILYKNDGTGRSDFIPGNISLTFAVSDIHAVAQELRDAGYPDIGEPKDYTVFLLLLVRDPDGNMIELSQETGKGTLEQALESYNAKPAD